MFGWGDTTALSVCFTAAAHTDMLIVAKGVPAASRPATSSAKPHCADGMWRFTLQTDGFFRKVESLAYAVGGHALHEPHQALMFRDGAAPAMVGSGRSNDQRPVGWLREHGLADVRWNPH
jgi:hypothetical protein